jgi:8-oxo-dGTP diphosphatase
MLGLILNPKEKEPTGYTDRITVKAVIVNDVGETLRTQTNLIGGGVENNETDEEALHREILEETGMQVEIIKPLGQIIAYRDHTKQKYIYNGYLCRYVSQVSHPTTTDEKELKTKLIWSSPEDAINYFTGRVEEYKNTDQSMYPEGTHEIRTSNQLMALNFLKEAFK